MNPGLSVFVAIFAIGIVVQTAAAHAGGVCSTGAFKTCVSCCKSHPTITNREICTYQCGEYKIRDRQKKG